ncbi:MAG: LPD38 domain-containing protein, partial [Bacteroidota bacterium]
EGVNLIAFNEEGEVRFFNALGRRMESVAERSENMSRIATYIMALEKGKSLAEAATEAKNITVNFNRKGELSPVVGCFYGFVNAAIQGFENGSRLAYEHRGAFIKSAATFYSMGFLNALLSHMMVDDGEEDWYAGVNDYIKQNYFTIGYGEGKYVSIPLPHFHRAFYGAGVSTFENLFYDKVSGNHSEWIDSGKGLDKMGLDFLNLAIDMGSPVNPVEFLSKEDFSLMGVLKPFAPMTATPILDIVENRDFANRPVVKEPYTQGIDEHLANAGRFKRDVNGAAKWFTDKLFQAGGGDINTYAKRPIKDREVQDRVPIPMDINPSGVEHLVTYYFGGRGQFVNNLYKTVSSTVEGVNNAIEGKEAPFVDFDPNNVPILRRYNRKSYDYGLYNQYFQIQEEIDAYEFNLREMDRKEEIQSMNPKYMIMKEKLKSVEDRRKSIRDRMNSPAIVGEPRKIKELREEEKELIQNFLNSLAQ